MDRMKEMTHAGLREKYARLLYRTDRRRMVRVTSTAMWKNRKNKLKSRNKTAHLLHIKHIFVGKRTKLAYKFVGGLILRRFEACGVH